PYTPQNHSLTKLHPYNPVYPLLTKLYPYHLLPYTPAYPSLTDLHPMTPNHITTLFPCMTKRLQTCTPVTMPFISCTPLYPPPNATVLTLTP
ncbi:predicted protein, partial [Nematostella vectensis]